MTVAQAIPNPLLPTGSAFSADLELTLVSRRPARLTEQTVRVLAEAPVPVAPPQAGAPRASVVIVTHNQLPFTKLCLASLLANTARPDPSYEVIVVDNASCDGTVEYLRDVAAANAHVRASFNATNLGFAAASNRGLRLAKGEVLVLLNNDTAVPNGWLAGLLRHLDEPAVGAVGPVTNRIGNEAEIETSYRTYREFEQFARARAAEHAGASFDIPTPCMFCLALRRETFDWAGPLDERFEVGLLEDDDYALRVRAAGYRTLCAEDVFVHHFGQASFGELVPTGEYGRLLEANKRRFEQKWGRPWEPYGRRRSERYARMSQRLRVVADAALPHGATVAVVSKGDPELLALGGGRTGWHFPRASDGTYAGHYPADSTAALEHLEELRESGAQFLLLPATSRWWMQHYPAFGRRLQEVFRVLHDEPDVGLLVDLRPSSETRKQQ